MPQRHDWRFFGLAIAAFAAIVSMLAGFEPWDIRNARLQSRVASELQRATGLAVRSQGGLSLTLLPTPRLHLRDVRLASADTMLEVEAGFIDAVFALLPLIGGRFEFSAISVDSAHIRAGPAELSVADRNQAATSLARGSVWRPLRLALTNSSVSLRVPGADSDIAFSGVNLKLDWPFEDAPASFAGHATLFEAPATIAGFVAQPGNLLREASSLASFQLTSPAFVLALIGTARSEAGLHFEGKLHGSSQQLLSLLQPEGTARADAGLEMVAGRLSEIDADMVVGPAGAQLSSVRIAMGASTLEGSLQANILDPGSANARFSLNGTLAAPDLDLTLVTNLLPAWLNGQGQWNPAPLNVHWLHKSDLDLRVSVGRVAFGTFKGEDLALSLLVRNRRFDLGLKEMHAYGGRVRANLAGTLAAAWLDAKGEAQFSNVDVARFARDAPRLARLSGMAQGSASLATHGGSAAALAAGLNGTAELNLANGAIQGVNFEQALRRLERRPASIPAALTSGPTAFDSLTVPAWISDGVARVSEGLLTGPAVRAVFQGDIDFGQMQVSLTSLASATGPAGVDATGPPQRLAVDINGRFGDIALVPRLTSSGPVIPASGP